MMISPRNGMSCGKSPSHSPPFCDVGGDRQPWERVVGFSAGSTSSSTRSSATASVVSPSNKPSNVALSLLEGIRMSVSQESEPMMRETEEPLHSNEMDECHDDDVDAPPHVPNLRPSVNHPDVSFSGWASPPAADDCPKTPVLCIEMVDDEQGGGKAPMRSPAMVIPALKSRVVADDKRPRVIRRVPEPPAAPSAVTAPAVVQMLMASQAAAAAEQARLEQNAMCRRNNLKMAYAAQEKLLSFQAKAERLEAELSGVSQHRRSAGRQRSYQGDARDGGRCEWQEWYQRPHCRAVADFCSGLEDTVTVRGTAWKSAPQPPLDC